MFDDLHVGIGLGLKLAGRTAAETATIFKEHEHLPIVSSKSLRRWFLDWKTDGQFERKEKSGRPSKLSKKTAPPYSAGKKEYIHHNS